MSQAVRASDEQHLPTAGTRSGVVRGAIQEGIFAFKGIPFAAPPTGPDRLMPPRPEKAWEGVRDASQFGPTGPRPEYYGPFGQFFPEPIIDGAEYLNLNVWTPELGDARLPVMVFIHGGNFMNGSGAVPTYDGQAFARDGVVLVTFNYRLGAEGSLFLDDGICNLGLQDQIAALDWVQENIAGFGGDPDNVTIFGESAGGQSVVMLLSGPGDGRFRRAIAQSGGGQKLNSPASARKVAQMIAQQLGVAATRSAIAAVPADELISAQVAVAAEIRRAGMEDPVPWGDLALYNTPFNPTLDGQLIERPPIESIASGVGGSVDLLIGTNVDEIRLRTVPNGALGQFTDDDLRMFAGAYGLDPDEAIETYGASRPGASAGDVLVAIQTDWVHRIQAVRVAEARWKAGAATHLFEFAWCTPEFDGRLGACHTLELPFVFDTLVGGGMEKLTGPEPPQALADLMHATWLGFARDGKLDWPTYEPDGRSVMTFNEQSHVVEDPRAAERLLWEGRI